MFYAFDTSNGGDLSWKEFSSKLITYCTDYDVDLDVTEIQYLFNGLDLDVKKKLTPDELEFLDDWDLALDLEEEQVFPHFRLWSTGDVTKNAGPEVNPAAAAQGRKTGDSHKDPSGPVH